MLLKVNLHDDGVSHILIHAYTCVVISEKATRGEVAVRISFKGCVGPHLLTPVARASDISEMDGHNQGRQGSERNTPHPTSGKIDPEYYGFG